MVQCHKTVYGRIGRSLKDKIRGTKYEVRITKLDYTVVIQLKLKGSST